jgi:predicted RecB family nuclease
MGGRDYRLRDGTRVDGVSEVLDGVAAFSLRHVPRKVLEPAAAIGTEVHELIRRCFVAGGHLGYTPAELSPESKAEVASAMAAFAEFMGGYQIEPLRIELPVVSEEHRIGGTPDFVGLLDGVPTIIDWKTYAVQSPRTIVQLAAYTDMLASEGIFEAEHLAEVRLDKKGGGYEVMAWPVNDDDIDIWRRANKQHAAMKAASERWDEQCRRAKR